MMDVVFSAVVLAAAATPKTFSDDPAHYVLRVPAGCTVRAKVSATLPAFIDCAKGFARVATATGTTQPVLQKLVNTIIGDWSNLKLLENQMSGKLGGAPARVIYAEGTAQGEPCSIEMLAATHDGRWYVLVMASPQNEWVADGARYFATVKTGFTFTAKPAAPAKK